MKYNKTVQTSRRVLCFILAFVFMFTFLCGCGKDEKNDPQKTTVAGKQGSEDSNAEESTGEESQSKADDTTAEGTSSGTKGSTQGGTSGGGSGGGKTHTTRKSTQTYTTRASQTQATQAPKSNTYYPPQVKTNYASGTLVASSSYAKLDYSNTHDGYIMCMYFAPYVYAVIMVKGPNGSQVNYSVSTQNYYFSIPLTAGSGTYSITIAGNTDGSTQYSVILSQQISVSLSYSAVAYTRPNINVDYSSGTSAVNYAAQLTRGCDTDLAKIQAIYNYVCNNFRYDYSKASRLGSDNTGRYHPNLNSTWSSGSGICYDLAAITIAMLRTQGLTAKMEVGTTNYVNGLHAWVSVYTAEKGTINGGITFYGSWKRIDPTAAITGQSGVAYDWGARSFSVTKTY